MNHQHPQTAGMVAVAAKIQDRIRQLQLDQQALSKAKQVLAQQQALKDQAVQENQRIRSTLLETIRERHGLELELMELQAETSEGKKQLQKLQVQTQQLQDQLQQLQEQEQSDPIRKLVAQQTYQQQVYSQLRQAALQQAHDAQQQRQDELQKLREELEQVQAQTKELVQESIPTLTEQMQTLDQQSQQTDADIEAVHAVIPIAIAKVRTLLFCLSVWPCLWLKELKNVSSFLLVSICVLFLESWAAHPPQGRPSRVPSSPGTNATLARRTTTTTTTTTTTMGIGI